MEEAGKVPGKESCCAFSFKSVERQTENVRTLPQVTT